MKPYSRDLRQKILHAYAQRLGSPRALAALFGVSQSFLEKVLQRRRTSAAMAPRPYAGGRQPHCNAAALTLIRQWVREQPDATLEELCTQLQQQCGLRVSVPTMSRILTRLGLPRKKVPPGGGTRDAARPAGAGELWALDRGPGCPAPEGCR
jgi:transposase